MSIRKVLEILRFWMKFYSKVRTLSILTNDERGCVAHYAKKGKDEVIARAKSPELCHDRVKQLQEILKSANYRCRTFAKAQVTTSSEVIQ